MDKTYQESSNSSEDDNEENETKYSMFPLNYCLHDEYRQYHQQMSVIKFIDLNVHLDYGKDSHQNHNTSKEQEKMPLEIRKQQQHRHCLFSRQDEFKKSKIHIDEEGWQSITPEVIANKLSKYLIDLMKSENPKNTPQSIVDLMCGQGGNIIQFAKEGFNSFAVDIDESKISNAKLISNVQDLKSKIKFYSMDYNDFIEDCVDKNRWFDQAFISPPWYGPKQCKRRLFDVNENEDCSFEILIESIKSITDNIVIFYPRNIVPSHLCKSDNKIVIQKIKTKENDTFGCHILIGKIFDKLFDEKEIKLLIYKSINVQIENDKLYERIIKFISEKQNDHGIDVMFKARILAEFSKNFNEIDFRLKDVAEKDLKMQNNYKQKEIEKKELIMLQKLEQILNKLNYKNINNKNKLFMQTLNDIISNQFNSNPNQQQKNQFQSNKILSKANDNFFYNFRKSK